MIAVPSTASDMQRPSFIRISGANHILSAGEALHPEASSASNKKAVAEPI